MPIVPTTLAHKHFSHFFVVVGAAAAAAAAAVVIGFFFVFNAAFHRFYHVVVLFCHSVLFKFVTFVEYLCFSSTAHTIAVRFAAIQRFASLFART